MRTKSKGHVQASTYLIFLFMVVCMFLIAQGVSGAYLDQEWKSKRLNPEGGDPYGLLCYDIDGDNVNEILMGTDHSSIEVYNGQTKDFEWDISFSKDYLIVYSIDVADVDSDGELEIIASLSDGWSGGFAVADVKYKVEEYINTTLGDTRAVMAADVDGNPGIEILAEGNTKFYVFGSDGAGYKELWRSPIVGEDIRAIEVGNIDGDLDDEIIVGYRTSDDLGGVTVFTTGYEEEWNKTDFPDPVWSLTAFKGKLYIGTGQESTGSPGYDGSIYIYDGDTEVQSNDLGGEIHAIVIKDFDGDSIEEIVVGNNYGLVVYNLAFTKQGEAILNGMTSEFGNLYVQDVDQDNVTEIITSSYSNSSQSYVMVMVKGVEDPGDNGNGGGNGTGSSDEFDIPLLGQFIAGTMCFMVCCGLPILGLLIGIWNYKDAEARGKSGAVWLVINILLPFLGAIIWLLVRPKSSAPGGRGGMGAYSGSGYSQGEPGSSGPRGKGKVALGMIFIVLGAVLFAGVTQPYMGIEPTQCREEFEENPDGEWTVYGHLADKEGWSFLWIGDYNYTFEEDRDLQFKSNEDLGSNGQAVVVTLQGVQGTDGNWTLEFKEEHFSSSYFPGLGIFMIFIGVIMLIVGGKTYSKTKHLKKKKKKKGDAGGAGNVDISHLIGGSSPPGMDLQPQMPGMDPNAPPISGDPYPDMPPMMRPDVPPGQGGPQQPGLQGPPSQRGGEYGGMQELPGMDLPPPPGPTFPMPQQPGQGQPPTFGMPHGMPPGGQPDGQPVGQFSGQPGGQPGTQTTMGGQGMGMPSQQAVPPGTQPPPPPPGVYVPGRGYPAPPGQGQPTGPPIPAMGQQQPQGVPPVPQYQPQNWTCPNCQSTVEIKYAFCTSCGYKRHA